ncbi:MAG: SEL1-like repeat protein, partial [Pseudomonadota bacterium]
EELDFGEISYVCTCKSPYKFNTPGTRCLREAASQPAADAPKSNTQEAAHTPVPKTDPDAALRAWTQAKYLNTKAAYRQFLADHPNSRYATQARQILTNTTPQVTADSVFSKAWTKDQAGKKRKAFRLYRQAAEMGHSQAMNNLGVFYHNGYGTRRSFAQAGRWYQKAVDLGNPDAMLNLGSLYDDGQGVRRDRPRAADLVARAIKGGSDYALTSMVSNSIQWSRQFRRELQKVMRAEGYYDGRIDGSFGAGTRRSLKRLAGQE